MATCRLGITLVILKILKAFDFQNMTSQGLDGFDFGSEKDCGLFFILFIYMQKPMFS